MLVLMLRGHYVSAFNVGTQDILSRVLDLNQ